MSTPVTGDRRTATPHAMPHWLTRRVWVVHLAGYRLTAGRLGLSRPTPARRGHLRMVEAWCTGKELPAELRREPAPAADAVERMRRRVAAAA